MGPSRTKPPHNLYPTAASKTTASTPSEMTSRAQPYTPTTSYRAWNSTTNSLPAKSRAKTYIFTLPHGTVPDRDIRREECRFHIYLNAVSAAPLSRLVLNIHRTCRHVPSNNVIGDLLWPIAQFSATKKRFDEMEFDMIIKATGSPPLNQAAEGFFFRMDAGAGVAPA